MGYDPYDGLNSQVFRKLPLISDSKFFRLAWIQFFKRSPFNLRPLLGVKADYNPKAIGLFLSAYVKLYKIEQDPKMLSQIDEFTGLLMQLKTEGYSGDCWGYNFDWQAKAFFQPKGTPTIVATSFIANALIDAYELTHDNKLLNSARSSCDFILNDLNINYNEDGDLAFSYSPLDHSVVYNASLLGARLLSRTASFTGEEELKKIAKSAVAFAIKQQQPDGSWAYGTYDFHQWKDSFHTGYNLECIADYMKYSGDNSCQSALQKGFEFYINTFFTKNGIPRYYSHKTYPIDIHSPSQLVITLHHLGLTEKYRYLMDSVIKWTIDHMQTKKGCFIYQINKWGRSAIPYMRWSQAWMMLALSTYLYAENEKR
jgi:rhamnogalacturonyl hydrolase YesR